MDINAVKVVTTGRQWIGELPDLDDLEVLVAPWENADFNKVLDRAVRSLPAGLRADGNIEPAAYYRCVGTAIAKAILFDWKNFKVGTADQPFDPEIAKVYLTDPAYRPFRDGVIAAAKRAQHNRVAEAKALEGNSVTSSPGSASGEVTPIG